MHFVAFWKEMAKELGEEYSPRQGDQTENPSKPNKMFHLARWEGSVGSKWKPIVIKMKQMKMLHTVRFPKLLLLIHEIQSLALTPPDRFWRKTKKLSQ